MTMADTIAAKLTAALSPDEIEVVDVSHQHAGHGGWREGGETHFEVRMKAAAFSGKSRSRPIVWSTACWRMSWRPVFTPCS